MFLLLKCISCHECLVVKHRKRHYPLSAIYIVCGFKNLFVLLEEENWSLYLSVSGAGEGEGGGRHEMLFSSDLWLIGRESVFRLVVAEAQTFVYITGERWSPHHQFIPPLSHLKEAIAFKYWRILFYASVTEPKRETRRFSSACGAACSDCVGFSYSFIIRQWTFIRSKDIEWLLGA